MPKTAEDEPVTEEEEAIARRICAEFGEDPDAPNWQTYIEAARAEIAARGAP